MKRYFNNDQRDFNWNLDYFSKLGMQIKRSNETNKHYRLSYIQYLMPIFEYGVRVHACDLQTINFPFSTF